jgi:hypothetical protein
MSVRRMDTSFASGLCPEMNMEGYKSFSFSNFVPSNHKNPIPISGDINMNLDVNQYLISFILSNYSLPKIDLEKFSEIYFKFSQTNEGNLSTNTFIEVLKLLLIEAISSQNYNCEEDSEKGMRPLKNIIIKPPEMVITNTEGTFIIICKIIPFHYIFLNNDIIN